MNHGTLWSSEATRSVSERFVGEDDGEDDGVEEVEFVYIPDSLSVKVCAFPCSAMMLTRLKAATHLDLPCRCFYTLFQARTGISGVSNVFPIRQPP